MSDVHRCMIIPVSTLASVKGLADKFGRASQGMWITELSPTGNAPATHMISTGAIGLEFAGIMPLKKVTKSYQTDAQGKTTPTLAVEDTLANPQAMIDLSTVHKVKGVPSSTVYAALMAQVDVSDQPPFEAMARMGLKIIRKP